MKEKEEDEETGPLLKVGVGLRYCWGAVANDKPLTNARDGGLGSDPIMAYVPAAFVRSAHGGQGKSLVALFVDGDAGVL